LTAAHWWSTRSGRLLLNAALLSAALYISLTFGRIPGKSSAIWLASGLQIGLLLRLARNEWPASLAVFFALTLIGVAWSGPQRWALALGWPTLNSLGVLLAAHWLSRDGDWVAGRSERLAAWLRFALIGGIVMPGLWGAFGATMLLSVVSAPWTMSGFGQAALGRFVNNALGIFVLVPMVLRCGHLRRLREPGRLLEALLMLGAFAGFAAAVFLQDSPLPLFIVLLPVVLMLFRLEFVGTMACMAILLFAAVGLTLGRHGPFIAMARGDWVYALLLAQCYLMVTFATIVLMTGLLAERQALALRTVELATESARMKSEFLAKMSHEIRTPLNAIIGFAELMRHDPSLSANNLQHVRIINQSGDHLLALIDEVLDMAKVEAGRLELSPKDIHLPAFLDTVIAMMAIRAERKGLKLVLDDAPGLPAFVRADEVKLRQVFLNLLGNAIKFSERGQVALEVRYLAGAETGQGELRAAVKDTGPGIAPAELPGLFVAFQQGREGRHSQGGTGLGLVISKSFVELMGGAISVESTLGQGSCFSFSVKVGLAAAGTPEDRQREAIGLAPGQRAPRVLVADDVEANRLLLERLMQRLGVTVECVANGQQALDLFPALRPDLIWMDLVMPVMCGDVAAQRIRALEGGREVKIVCVTASAFNGERDARIDGSFDGVLVKPVSEARLVEAMRGLLGVEFIYREADAPAAALPPVAGLDDAGLLASTAASWQSDFRSAVISGDVQRVQTEIDALPQPHAALRARLQWLLDRLDLEALATLCRPLDTRREPAAPGLEAAPAA